MGKVARAPKSPRAAAGGSAYVERVFGPAGSATVVAKDHPHMNGPRLCGCLPAVGARRVRVARLASGAVVVEGTARREPCEGDCFALVDDALGLEVEARIALRPGAPLRGR